MIAAMLVPLLCVEDPLLDVDEDEEVASEEGASEDGWDWTRVGAARFEAVTELEAGLTSLEMENGLPAKERTLNCPVISKKLPLAPQTAASGSNPVYHQLA